MKHEMWLVVAATLVFGAAATLVTSKLHWGYWVSPPSPDATVASLRHLGSFTTMWRGYPPHSGHDAIVKAAEDVNWSSGEDPRGRLPATLIQRGFVPRSSEPVAGSLLPKICQFLETHGALEEADPGYTESKELSGHLALGRGAHGNSVAVAALWGGQLSNDHYPYYEASFAVSASGELTLLSLQKYRFDIAGLEGVEHWLAGCAASLLSLLVWVGYRIARRLGAPRAAGQPALRRPPAAP